MAIKSTKRKFAMSDGTLIQVADDKLDSATRDLTEMQKFGYTQTELDAITAIRDAFFGFANDDYYSGLISEATADKNQKVFAMSDTAEDIIMIAERTYGAGSSSLSVFGFTGYGKKRDADKLVVCKTIHKAATERLTALTAKGLTQTILDDFADEITAADTALTVKDMKVKERDGATQDRVKKGNELYDKLVEVCKTGKHIWEDKDEAKYNDYIITPTHNEGTQVVTGTPAANAIHIPDVVVDDTADSVEINNTGTTPLFAYFSDDVTEQPDFANGLVVAGGEKKKSNAGDFGWSAQKPLLLIFNKSTTDAGAFELTVS